ncbi:MAG: hypothetical protein U9R08_05030 [Nanoarchaeota archaeon]|nr:hypothetical protein [Nanoarchaeota archaeon]
MKPKLVKMFNSGDENYFRLQIEYKDSYAYEEILIEFFKEVGFEKSLYSKDRIYKNEEDHFKRKTYKEWMGRQIFLENANYKIHVIFDDYLHMVVKCEESGREKMVALMKKHFDQFEE